MKIDISDILSFENKEVKRSVEIELNKFLTKMGEFPIFCKDTFELTLTNVENEKVWIRGNICLSIEIPCDRCLESVKVPFVLNIEKEIPIQASLETKIEESDVTTYVIGNNLDVDQLIYNEILVHWPMKVLCKDNCKGICKRCGGNLNLEACDCQKTELDPRMAAIQDVFNKFKEV